jgi:hypothetical protein
MCLALVTTSMPALVTHFSPAVFPSTLCHSGSTGSTGLTSKFKVRPASSTCGRHMSSQKSLNSTRCVAWQAARRGHLARSLYLSFITTDVRTQRSQLDRGSSNSHCFSKCLAVPMAWTTAFEALKESRTDASMTCAAGCCQSQQGAAASKLMLVICHDSM